MVWYAWYRRTYAAIFFCPYGRGAWDFNVSDYDLGNNNGGNNGECPPDLTITNYPGNQIQAASTITCSATVEPNTDLECKAGTRITLTNGFHAKEDSYFHAKIEGCSANKEEVVDNEPISLRNYPNPFTGQTTIEFKLSKDTPVTLFVSDPMGKQIAILLDNDEKTEGTHSVIFDANNYPAGMYYYTIQAGEYYGTQKMILAK